MYVLPYIHGLCSDVFGTEKNSDAGFDIPEPYAPLRSTFNDLSRGFVLNPLSGSFEPYQLLRFGF